MKKSKNQYGTGKESDLSSDEEKEIVTELKFNKVLLHSFENITYFLTIRKNGVQHILY